MRKLLTILLTFCIASGFVGCSSKTAEVQSASKPVNIVLLPQDADLTEAPDVVVEPEDAPYNLGGWKDGNTVSWDVNIPKADRYTLVLNYSRLGQYSKDWGIIEVEKADGQTQQLNFEVLPSGENKDNHDWSVYIDNDSCRINLPAGQTKISVSPNMDTGSPYFINLKSIKIIGKSTDNQTAEVSIDKHLKKIVGNWYKHGDINDDFMQINEDGTWTLNVKENGSYKLEAEGTMKYDKGQIGFIDTMSNNTYYSHPSTDGSLMYIGDCFFPDKYSVDGFKEYDGTWYLEGDLNDNYVKIKDGHWVYFESSGSGGSSNLSGYLASDGEKSLLAYNASTNEKYGRIGLLKEGMISFNARDYYLFDTDDDGDGTDNNDLSQTSGTQTGTDNRTAWYGNFSNDMGNIHFQESFKEGYINYDIRLDNGYELGGELLPNNSNGASDVYVDILLVDGDTVQVSLVDSSIDAFFAGTYKRWKN